MNTVEENLANWQGSLRASIPIADLLARNPIVYKWKAPFSCWVLREVALWRITDLLTQSYTLHEQGHGLGARILLRSGFETLATLVYLNQKMRAVIDSEMNFHSFSDLTIKLVAGSKNRPGRHIAINILTMLDKGDGRYPGLRSIYDGLSESAHPNFEGMTWGYSKVDHDEYQTNFSNRWMELHGERHLELMELCMMTFHHEYDDIWTDLMDKLEVWIAANDAELEATKNDPTPG